jgi:hypothetical protein
MQTTNFKITSKLLLVTAHSANILAISSKQSDMYEIFQKNCANSEGVCFRLYNLYMKTRNSVEKFQFKRTPCKIAELITKVYRLSRWEKVVWRGIKIFPKRTFVLSLLVSPFFFSLYTKPLKYSISKTVYNEIPNVSAANITKTFTLNRVKTIHRSTSWTFGILL